MQSVGDDGLLTKRSDSGTKTECLGFEILGFRDSTQQDFLATTIIFICSRTAMSSAGRFVLDQISYRTCAIHASANQGYLKNTKHALILSFLVPTPPMLSRNVMADDRHTCSIQISILQISPRRP